MEQQRVTEALLAATLSRNLERPRIETDGRFLRAIRLAEADGTYRQKLEAKYEYIWTAFWWFDDYQILQDSYNEFEALALKTNQCMNLELLCNLLQLFINLICHKQLSQKECQLEERIAKLKNKLEKMAADNERPNNALEAQSFLILIKMNNALLDNQRGKLSDIWYDFTVILEKAKGLGEFKADRLVKIIEVAGEIAGNDPAYNDLIDKTADFVSKRKSEAEGALILLKRAQKLDFDSNFELIRLLGKATIGLAKKEYADYLIEALELLMLAYRNSGLLWAARSCGAFLAASLVLEAEESSELPVSFVFTMEVYAWIVLELGHIPDFLLAVNILNNTLDNLPLTDDSKDTLDKKIQELDRALGCLLLNLDENELYKLESLPDILENLGLFISRISLLYLLGYINVLREDGSLPQYQSDEEVNHIFSTLASEPFAQDLRSPLVLNSEEAETLSTSILGMAIDIHLTGNIHSIMIAEAVLGSVEAFFATAIEQRIVPHTEKVILNLIESEEVSKPSFQLNPMDMVGSIIWPVELSPNSFENQREIQQFWAEISGQILAKCCVIKDITPFLDKLNTDEAVYYRMQIVSQGSISYHRFSQQYVSRINDWQDSIKRVYELSNIRPSITHISIIDENTHKERNTINDRPPMPTDHRKYSVCSVLDIHTWDLAQWQGMAYAQFRTSEPPYMAFLFNSEENGRKIFERWQERFGKHDQNDEIAISIVRQLPGENKHHYHILLTSKLPKIPQSLERQIFTIASRSITMTPSSDKNLDNFLNSYKESRSFYLLPAVVNTGGSPKFIFDLAILKHNLSVKLASEINKNDIESMFLPEL